MSSSAVYVYRCFDENDRLIYVGMTKNLWTRMAQHRRYTWWAPQTARVRATVHPSRARGRNAERAAIRRGRPRWNLDYYHATPARLGWDVGQYEDYVLARYRSCPISVETYQHLLRIQHECSTRLGHKLDIGLPPPPGTRTGQFLPPTSPAALFESLARDGVSVDDAAYCAATARGLATPRMRAVRAS